MIPAIRPAQLAAWLAEHTSANGTLPVVLDVREAWELKTASVRPAGFELLHVPMHTIPARLQDLPQDRAIACLCHHGARSAQVTHFLLQHGFDEVVNLHGGIHAWSHEVDAAVPQY